MLGCLDHRLGVGNIAIGDHARQVLAWHGQNEGRGAGGEQQAIVFRFRAIGRNDLAGLAVELHNLLAGMQRDAVVAIPVQVVDDDVGQGHFSRQHRGKQDAVVVGMRLGAEHSDLVEIGRELEQFFEGAAAGHAVTDHHQFEFLH